MHGRPDQDSRLLPLSSYVSAVEFTCTPSAGLGSQGIYFLGKLTIWCSIKKCCNKSAVNFVHEWMESSGFRKVVQASKLG